MGLCLVVAGGILLRLGSTIRRRREFCYSLLLRWGTVLKRSRMCLRFLTRLLSCFELGIS